MPNRAGNRIKDRPEYRTKPQPLTFQPQTSVAEAVKAMSARNYGSVVVTEKSGKVVGLVTERDILKRLVNEGRQPETTKLSDLMTENPRVASEEDDLLDWLRLMSNERFRRLPIVDADGRIISILTQGDFVSYTWPDLLYQAKEITRATFFKNFNGFMIAGSMAICAIAMIALFRTF